MKNGSCDRLSKDEIEKAVHGNLDSMGIVIKKYSPYLWVVLRNRIRKGNIEIDHASMEDIWANVLGRFMTGIRRFKFLKSEDCENEMMFDSYCKTIIRHEIRDELKRYLSQAGKYVVLPLDELNRIISGSRFFSPLEYTEFHFGYSSVYVEHEELLEELLKLRPTYKKVIGLSYFLDYTDAEIAELMNLKIASVYEYKHEAILALKKALGVRL